VTRKLLTDIGLIWRKSLREARRDAALAFIFPMLPPLFFAVLQAVTYSDVVDLPGFPVDDYIVWVAPGAVLLPGAIGAGFTATSTVLDARSGYLDRLRLLPVSPYAVLAGRLLFDVVRVLPAAAVVLLTCVAMGAEVRTGVPGAVAVLGLTALLALAWNGIFYVATLRSMNPQTPMAMQPLFLPFLFLSSVYVPESLLPGWVQTVSDVNPLSYMADAARGFMTNPFDWGALVAGIAYPLAIAAATLALAARMWSAMNRAT
jgi:ABC-2 type transport system permease protein